MHAHQPLVLPPDRVARAHQHAHELVLPERAQGHGDREPAHELGYEAVPDEVGGFGVRDGVVGGDSPRLRRRVVCFFFAIFVVEEEGFARRGGLARAPRRHGRENGSVRSLS